MGYALQQKDAQTAPVQTPVDDAPQKTTPPPQDVVPEENKAAAGGDKDKDDAAKAEAEKKRAAEVTATWQGLLGKWLGGQLAPLVLEHVSVDALNGYVDEALKAAGPALGDALKGATKPDEKQAKALKDFSDALAGVLTGPEVADPRALHLAAREQLEQYLRFRQDEALLLLEQARRTQPDTLVTGVEAAWHTVTCGALPLMLVVEESFRFPAVVDEEGIRRLDWLHAPEMAPRGSHTDLVDDLIELVIDRGGWVAFADDDRLRSDRRVALVTTEA